MMQTALSPGGPDHDGSANGHRAEAEPMDGPGTPNGLGAEMGSVAIVSTFPPTACGLATFAAALSRGLAENGLPEIGVLRVCPSDAEDTSPVEPHPTVSTIGVLHPGSQASRTAALARLEDFDTVLIQHEYGIFGPDDGMAVLDLVADCRRPVITTLHSVPAAPTARQRTILERLVNESDSTVTMTWSARSRLAAGYRVDPTRLVSIPHGATVLDDLPVPDPAQIVTWGLLGPGKGIEWAIDALAAMPEMSPAPQLLVAGATHPNVLRRDGEAYREMLMARAARLGVSDRVIFDPSYRSVSDLLDLVSRATVVVLPYDSRDQVTSGVLVDAIAAGVPVVATAFPHAVELLSDGAGTVVPHGDPVAMSRALHAILVRSGLRSAMVAAGRPIAERHRWTAVAAEYMALARTLDLERSAVGW
jgi:glycosyltransferase involved in cell wall biosynthesis